MARWRFITTGFAAGLAVSPALACDPMVLPLNSAPERGENCAISWQIGEISRAGVDEARAIGPGIVYQQSFEGTACGWTIGHVVQDCRSGEILILGDSITDLMDQTTQTDLNRTTAAVEKAAAKPGFELAALRKTGAAHGMTKFDTATTRDRLRISGKAVDLGCGCKTLFPELGGQK